MTEPFKTEDQRTELALFRYSLILPLLRQEHEPGGKAALRRQIAAGRYDIPGSKRRRVGVSTLLPAGSALAHLPCWLHE